MMKPAWVTLISGLLLLIPASVGLFLTGVPTLLCPLPYLTVVPAFLLSSIHLERAASVIPAILFFAWNPSLFRGSSTIPKRTYVLFVIVAVMSVIWFIAGWKYGLQYQNPTYTHYICVLNIAWIAGLGIFLFLRRKSDPSFTSNLAFHLLFFAWLGWYAFPYLGELP
jgi:hypothetical protein